MRTVTITVGTQIDTEHGYYIVKDINEAGLCYCEEYSYGEDDEMVKEDAEARLTASDISRELHHLTGKNYSVIIER